MDFEVPSVQVLLASACAKGTAARWESSNGDSRMERQASGFYVAEGGVDAVTRRQQHDVSRSQQDAGSERLSSSERGAELITRDAVAGQDIKGERRLAIDETSKAKGQDYITVVADADQRREIEIRVG